MLRLQRIYSSVVGKKYIAAVTGVLLFLFLIGHVTGNMKAFLGNVDGVPDIDIYANYLRQIGVPMIPSEAFLWLSRAVLLGALILHVVTVVQLAMISQAARPIKYERQKTRSASFAAKYMMFTGFFLLFFIVFHLLHLTAGVIPESITGKFEHGRVYQNLYGSFFGRPVIALFYVVAMSVLGMHLFHGVWSLFQTLGLDNPDRNKVLRIGATVFAIALFVGFSSIPLAYMFGFMEVPPDYDMSKLAGH